jgi:predicted nucleic acid-binding protein
LRARSQLHVLAINPVVHAELSLAFERREELDAAVGQLELALEELPRPALFLAGKAFARHRAAGGARTTVLPDFMIGAHAAVSGMPLLTRDARRYATYFPTLRVVTPASR